MPKPSSAKDYTAFEKFVESVLEALFVGFRLHRAQHVFKSTGERIDFTLIQRSDPHVRMVVDAKFYESPITLEEVQDIQNQKSHPFFARHAALVFPMNCEISRRAKDLAEEKSVMLVRLPVTKEPRYGWERRWWVVPWKSHVGYQVGGASPEEAAQNAEWITGPYDEVRVFRILNSFPALTDELRMKYEVALDAFLSDLESKIIKMRFGMIDGHIYSDEECVDILKLRLNELREVEKEAIRKLGLGFVF